ncbi:MAG TPA: oligosaccharide flippase family protein [Candidatus Accumulibacter phosphatis]|nr:oligosaccharide flippase family protein [Candidatus Accumulibacter phosphatis]
MKSWRQLWVRFSGGAGSTVFKGMATLAIGTGVARIIGVASIPVLTRIYSPADYGVLSVFTSLVLMLVPIVTLRYVVAIPLPRHDGLAMNLMALSVGLMLCITLAVSLVLWAFGPVLLGLVSMEVLAPYWWLIVLGIVGTGSYELLSMWATRRKAYRIIAQTQVFQSAVGSFLKIGLGLLALKPLGLLLGQVVAQSGGSGSFVARFRSDFQRTAGMVTLRRMAFTGRYYWGFPVYRLPSQFLMVFSMQAPLLFAAALYDAETTGQLGLAMMALALPVNLLGQSIGKAYYAEVARLSRKAPGKILEITKSVQKRLFAIGVPSALAIIVFGPSLFSLIFGEIWFLAGIFASILAVSLLFQITSAPMIQVLNVFNQQKLFLAINGVRAIMLISLYLVFSITNLSAILFTIAYSGLMTLFYLAISYAVIRFLNVCQSARQNHDMAPPGPI